MTPSRNSCSAGRGRGDSMQTGGWGKGLKKGWGKGWGKGTGEGQEAWEQQGGRLPSGLSVESWRLELAYHGAGGAKEGQC
eukprot:90450-Chlamydomonas_euryale.AAC.1